MRRANELSLNGLGLTFPNPIVGAVVIDDSGNLIGEGFHSRSNQGAHAETNALVAAGNKAVGATLVVTLEPCNHHGKTPPCTEKIIESGIKKVVFGVSDPNKLASGGAAALQKAAAGSDLAEKIATELKKVLRAKTRDEDAAIAEERKELRAQVRTAAGKCTDLDKLQAALEILDDGTDLEFIIEEDQD